MVQAGDTLTGVAGEIGTSVDDLMAANGLTDPDLVYAGQTLVYWGGADPKCCAAGCRLWS